MLTQGRFVFRLQDGCRTLRNHLIEHVIFQFVQKQKTFAAKLGAVTGALLDQPGSVQKLWKMRDDAIKLSDRLAKFTQGVVEQLPQRATTSGNETT